MNEFGTSSDLIKDLQMAQYLRNTSLLYEEVDEIINNFIDGKLEELIQEEEFTVQQASYCEEYVNDNLLDYDSNELARFNELQENDNMQSIVVDDNVLLTRNEVKFNLKKN